ncbi:MULTISPECIES: hypothetical protein [Gammaproteobacteria]|uniref:hypothetical protein n=1 Tax=Gammaproteobacteria TaxID=1236 RepID=UPI00191270F3|nr:MULTISPECIES: hypothetical protein [Gammaproteobacteria]MBK5300520.1 hypothetical protein [Bacillus sp. TH86]MBK5320289.1 hypothetical protein [Bacillus sp. TH59]MBK5335239.1 hypothetical protein [Bacillus sp. TH57]MBK5309327.1 hypothetical protein [Pseudomonas sp. TH71]MBK5314788.1 hypothetical protein [Erwinia sp. TH79]
MNLRVQLSAEKDNFPNVLNQFDPTYSADQELTSVVQALSTQEASFAVDKYCVIQNIADVGMLLDRLLEIRRELWEIDATRIRTTISYKSAIKQGETEHALNIAQAPDGKVDAITEASLTKLSETKQMVGELESLHGEPGSSLNFSERMAKIRNIFKQDIESCYVRSNAVVEGISACFGVTHIIERPLPGELKYATFEGAAHLDDWVAWHRKLSRALEAVVATQIKHEFAIPLGTPFLYGFVAPIDHGVHVLRDAIRMKRPEKAKTLTEKLIDKIKAGHRIGFAINDPFAPPDLGDGFTIDLPTSGHATIDELSVRVVIPNDNDRFRWRFQVEIFAPDSFDSVIINACTGQEPLNWISSTSLKNRPVNGKWAIEFISAMKEDTADSRQINRETWPILDVVMFFRTTTTNFIGTVG